MTNTIWKFNIPVTDRAETPVPKTTQVLSADRQGNDLSLWYTLDPTDPNDARLIVDVVRTGELIPDDVGDFVGTAQFNDGAAVVHVFAKVVPNPPPSSPTPKGS